MKVIDRISDGLLSLVAPRRVAQAGGCVQCAGAHYNQQICMTTLPPFPQTYCYWTECGSC
ncbi:hypothetical protein Skr01_58340 [Sphaerisporangium krabiense]|uniref:Uncharacterized protein n=1 Tax=Sphaerisporangium krabiense TaxID=763782 RepID=A0A7W8Z8P8_9ACTN|nr:hypothetical protein [Sphaerisporangium krabiense]MBB5629400.1 hypothetical protein [Sphaerisporangium krabiense]GII65749.1 hypothetical protein Skr01_58340 [Sphaerisporangium krabiense]